MIWLIGNRGMLGSDVETMLLDSRLEYTATDLDVDITDHNALNRFIMDKPIRWIVNCSAYTAVDKAEDEEEKAYSINHRGVANIAEIARKHAVQFIHISTDYVFSGLKDGIYNEEDDTDPQSVYGRSKLAGEKSILDMNNRYYIVRTAWLYGQHGPNFVQTMLRLFREREEVRVVRDQWGSPTYSRDLASAVLAIVSKDIHQYGIYHFTNEGSTNWYEFALKIYQKAKAMGLIEKDINLVPISTEEYPVKAKRPKNSKLSKDKIKSALEISIRSWEDALNEYLSKL
mgnify:CR=1 FL=1